MQQRRCSAGGGGLGRLAGHETLVNAHRDLTRALGWPESAPPLEWIEVPKGEKGFLLPHPILKPTCVFEHLVKVDEKRFNRLIRGPEGDISDYWGNLRGHACVEAIREFSVPRPSQSRCMGMERPRIRLRACSLLAGPATQSELLRLSRRSFSLQSGKAGNIKKYHKA